MNGKRRLTDLLRPNSPSAAPILPPPLRRPIKSMREALQIQAHLTSSGLLSSDHFAAGRLLKFTADANHPRHTLLLLRQIPSPDAFCVNTALKSLSRSPDPRAALHLYYEMLHSGFAPNAFTFPVLSHACGRAASLADGEQCHAQALRRGLAPAIHVANSLVHMYATCGALDSARALFDDIPDRDTVSWNSMVGGYLKSGDLESARQLFDEMPERNVVSWNGMIGGYLRGRKSKCGLRLFREMGEEGLRGSETTMVSVATACGRIGWLREGMSVHGYFVRNFAEENLIFGTALVDMYSKCRRVDIAERVFDGMTGRNLVCWNAMVLGHCIHGCPEDGLALFNKMVGRGEISENGGVGDASGAEPTGIKPDEVTFVGVLCACARAGLLTEGKEYLDKMTSSYNLTPTFAHYWCMANLYGHLGHDQEAQDVLKDVPNESESLAWSGLFGFCRFRGDTELGEKVGKRLIEFEPFNASRYALLWNVYAAAGRWQDAHKVKAMMKERGLRVRRGFSLLDLNEIVHNFKVGDRSCPEIEKIYAMMDDFALMLKPATIVTGSIISCGE